MLGKGPMWKLIWGKVEKVYRHYGLTTETRRGCNNNNNTGKWCVATDFTGGPHLRIQRPSFVHLNSETLNKLSTVLICTGGSVCVCMLGILNFLARIWTIRVKRRSLFGTQMSVRVLFQNSRIYPTADESYEKELICTKIILGFCELHLCNIWVIKKPNT